MMLTCEEAVERTKQLIKEWSESLAAIKNAPTPASERDAWLLKVQAAQLASQIEDFRAQITAYEQLKAGQCRRFNFDSLTDVLTALLKARIASGLTQELVAERLELTPELVRRYENQQYQNAPLEVVLNLIDLLGVSISGEVALPNAVDAAAEVEVATPELVAVG